VHAIRTAPICAATSNTGHPFLSQPVSIAEGSKTHA
jgi:hypothetical protein